MRVVTLGKFKTVMQIIAIEVLLYQHDLEGLRLFHVGEVLLGCVVGLVVTFLMSKLRPAAARITARAVSAHQGGSVMNRNSLR